MTLEEFSHHIQRRNLGIRFTRDEQRLIYEHFDCEHEDVLPTSYLLRAANEEESHHDEAHSSPDSAVVMPDFCRVEEIKALISEAVERHRVQTKLPLNQMDAEKQLLSALTQDARNEGRVEESSLRATFKSQLAFDISEDDVSFLLKKLREDRGGQRASKTITFNNLVRFLRITDSDLDQNKVSDARSSTITLLRRRIKAIRKHRSSDEMEGRVAVLRAELGGVEEEKKKQHLASLPAPESLVSQEKQQKLAENLEMSSFPNFPAERCEGKKFLPAPSHDCNPSR